MHEELFETMPIGVVYLDSGGRISLANPAAGRILGLPLAELIGRTTMDARWRTVHEDGSDFPWETHPAMESLRTGHEVRDVVMGVFNLLLDDYVWIRLNAVPQFRSGEDKPYQVYATFEDITERRQLEIELRANETRLRAIVDNSPAAIYLKDTESRIILMNRQTGEIVGSTPEEAVGKTDFELFTDSSVAERMVANDRRVIEEGQSITIEETVPSADGLLTFLSVKFPIRDAGGRISGICGISTDITERKRIEETLRINEDRLRRAQESAHIGNWDWDLITGELYWAEENYRMYGLDPTVVTPTYQAFIDSVDPDDVDRINTAVAESIDNHKPFDIDMSVIFPDGERRVINSRADVIFDDNGVATRMVGTVQDITDRKRAEAALQKSERELREAQRMAHQGSWEWEIETDTVTWSEELFRIAGRDPKLAAPDYYRDHPLLYTPESMAKLDALVKEGLETGASYRLDLEMIHSDGSSRWTDNFGEVKRDANGKIIGLRGTAQDITERKRVVEALRRSEERYRSLFENMLEGFTYCQMLFVDELPQDYVYLEVNKAFASLTGLNNVVGKRVSEVIPGIRETDPQLFEIYGRVALTGQPEKFETYLKALGIWIAGSVYSTEKGHFVAVFENITERKRLEEQLIRAQRLEMAGRVAGQVAHDFNNLLSPLVGFPELIKADLPVGHPANQFCDIMMNSALQMAEINDELLTLGRRGHVGHEPICLNTLIREAHAHLMAVPRSLIVEVILADDLLPTKGSSAQLTRVLLNLLANARDAMQDIGLLQVKTENWYVEETFGELRRIPIGEYVKVQMIDSGCGIPAETIGRIFEPFYTTKQSDRRRGGGLGLTVVQAIVDDHAGYVEVESKVGSGTTFSLYLPVCRESAESAAIRETPRGTGTILVVDDDEVQRVLAEQLLKKLGYQVDTVPNGEAALAYLKDKSTDLLVLDMIMPGGIDGAETFRRTLQVYPKQRAIILSGFAETERVKEAIALGVRSYLRKPVTHLQLALAVRDALL